MGLIYSRQFLKEGLHYLRSSYRIPHPNSRRFIMNFKRLAALFGLGILGSVAIADIAKAGQFDAVHKWVDSATSKTYVYIPGQTAGQAVTGFQSPKNPKLKVVTLNNCGVGKVSKPSTSPILNITGASGATVNFSSKTSGADPTCTLDSTAGTYTSSWAGSTGDVLETATAYYVKGGSSAGAISVNITNDGTITSKANACGFVRVTVSDSRPMTTFKIGATDYSLSSVPAVTNPMICKKVGSNSFTYVPAI